MSNQKKVRSSKLLAVITYADTSQICKDNPLSSVIFKQYANEGAFRKFTSLFPGLGYAAGYKVGKLQLKQGK